MSKFANLEANKTSKNITGSVLKISLKIGKISLKFDLYARGFLAN